MKVCAVCGKELSAPIDEYGELRTPVCAGCFLEHKADWPTKREQLFVVEKRISALQEGLRQALETMKGQRAHGMRHEADRTEDQVEQISIRLRSLEESRGYLMEDLEIGEVEC